MGGVNEWGPQVRNTRVKGGGPRLTEGVVGVKMASTCQQARPHQQQQQQRVRQAMRAVKNSRGG